MSNLKDYQWPSSFTKNPKYIKKNSKQNYNTKLNKIEEFFTKKYGYNSILVPSARAGIALILRYLKFSRKNDVFINKWVSHCIFNTVGAFTNISTNYFKPDLIICVHKWGYEQKIINNLDKKFIIEDSVDSIILNRKKLFVNNGDYELFSLPKILGSVSGSIIITKSKDFYNYCKYHQKKNKQLGIYQSEQKFKSLNTNNNSFNTWLYHESWNTSLEHNAIEDIYKKLDNFEKIQSCIVKRQEIFKQKIGLNCFDNQRLGPLIAIPIECFKNKKKITSKLLLRHLHQKKSSFNKFKKVILLPIHFKIDQNKFNYYLNLIDQNIK